MSDELKPCPFCGGKVEISTYRNEGYQIECPNHEWPKRETWMEKRPESDIAADIGMFTWGISDEAKAALIEAWNTRAERTTTRNGKYRTRYGRRVPLCECCGYAIGDDRYNFCPKCGAKVVEQ